MVKRLHTKQLRYIADKKGRCRRSRPKSFTNEASAKAWAVIQGIKVYTLKNLKNPECKTKKLVVVPTA